MTKKYPTQGPGKNWNPDCNPASPREGSVVSSVLEALKAGEHLTPGDAWGRFGTSRLAAVIHGLRRQGWAISSERVTVRCRGGRLARVAQYSLPAKGAR